MRETRKNKNKNVDVLNGDFSKLDKDNMIELLEAFRRR